MGLSKKETFIKESIGISEDQIIKLRDVCRKLNAKKQTVWIAKELKKDETIIDKYSKLSDIIDWAVSTKCDLMKYDFNSAFVEQKKWHDNKCDFPKIKEKMISKEIEEDRVAFVTSSGDHFFYILTEEDLKYESDHMLHCIGWKNSDQQYSDKIKNGKSIILSLRDEENVPSLTIEIDLKTGRSLQVRGRKNAELTDLPSRTKKALTEFVLFAGDFKENHSAKILDMINKNVNYF